MSEARELHREAMRLLDEANAAKMRGEMDVSRVLREQAYGNERDAAHLLTDRTDLEPTRAILHKGAAILALDCGFVDDAERLVCAAIASDPPADVLTELRELYQRANFDRHLMARGIALGEAEFQLAMAGDSIAPAMALSDSLVQRIQDTEAMLYRTVERRRHRAFRERGPVPKAIRQDYALFVSAPRAASFAITCKLGVPKEQLELPSTGEAAEALEDMLTCLQLFERADAPGLTSAIPDEAYYRNFVALARRMAPDGVDVNFVGFTAQVGSRETRVALTRRDDSPSPMTLPSSVPKPSFVTVVGELLFARSKHGQEGRIRVRDDAGTEHAVVVPEGMMRDIVKPLYEERVAVSGRREGKLIMLEDVRPID